MHDSMLCTLRGTAPIQDNAIIGLDMYERVAILGQRADNVWAHRIIWDVLEPRMWWTAMHVEMRGYMAFDMPLQSRM